MPRGDRTGPLGMGPMTGRGAGFCAGFGTSGSVNSLPRHGFGTGAGRGFHGRGFGGGGCGRRHWFYATGLPGRMRFGGLMPKYQKPDQEVEMQMLRNQAQSLQSELDSIRERLSEIETVNEAK